MGHNKLNLEGWLSKLPVKKFYILYSFDYIKSFKTCNLHNFFSIIN